MMDEYKEYIKWIAKNIYTEKFKNIKIDPEILFYNVCDGMIAQQDKEIIFVVDCNFEDESVYKIFKYSKILSENYKILDISIFKGNDKINFSGTFLISFLCVSNKKYLENQSTYDDMFKKYIINTERMILKIEKIYNIKKRNIIFTNNIKQNEQCRNINNIYEKQLDLLYKYNNSISKVLSKNLNIKNCKLAKYDIELNKIIPYDYSVQYIDEIMNVLNNRIISGYKKIKKSKFKKKIIIKNITNPIAIIKVQNNEKILEICKQMNYETIIVSENTKGAVNSIRIAEKICGNKKVLCIIDNKKDIIESETLVYIDISKKSILTSEDLKKIILEKLENLKVLANIDNNNSIKVLTGTFLNFNGTEYYSGGAERYLLDLHEVCKLLGYKLRIYQKANYEFLRFYGEIEVQGLSSNCEDYNYETEQDDNILIKYAKIAKNKSMLNIYSSFMECHGKTVHPSVGISHGVAWDHKKNIYNPNMKQSIIDDKSWIIDSAKACDKLVSVDTNTANYFQTIDYKLGNTTEVIPNYVDIDEFNAKNEYNKDKIVIVYPRRLYEPRGMYLLLNIVDELLEKYNNLEIHFVGKGFKSDTDKILDKIKKWGDNKIKMYSRPPELMHTVYEMADIALIPTLYSEGTSLSCLEAMASENAVIATRVGGLTDLIINNYNGKLIEPNEKSLKSAIEEFINDEELRYRCQKNAREVAKTFNKKIWIEKWKKIIQNNAIKLDISKKIVKYNKIKIIMDDENNIELLNLKKFIYDKLLDNNIVYIVINNEEYKKKSFERLQFIVDKDELYFEFDEVYNASEI